MGSAAEVKKMYENNALVVQMEERNFAEVVVAGSSPAECTNAD